MARRRNLAANFPAVMQVHTLTICRQLRRVAAAAAAVHPVAAGCGDALSTAGLRAPLISVKVNPRHAVTSSVINHRTASSLYSLSWYYDHINEATIRRLHWRCLPATHLAIRSPNFWRLLR